MENNDWIEEFDKEFIENVLYGGKYIRDTIKPFIKFLLEKKEKEARTKAIEECIAEIEKMKLWEGTKEGLQERIKASLIKKIKE